MVRSLVALVQAPVNLVQAHPPQGGLISVVSRQVVVRPGLGLIGFVWVSFCEKGEKETGLLFTGCAGVWGRVGCIQVKGGSGLH